MNPSRSDESATVLLVDDNRHGLAARKALLQELGYSVGTATCGLEALKLLEQREYDIIVTDYKMPEMNGVELIRHVRSRRPHARIIMLSGFVEPLGLSEESTGADVVVPKCANEVNILIRTVERLLHNHRRRKPPVSQRQTRKARAVQ